ncbi:hypothetical protein V5O48_005659 [Marasmius crinis-equi]|uniref:Uncharacterized protein n=1 Tax=Marasmius crinis-equi TaxID=585013 RepID=A0ABR3FKB2_9AGAR
MDGLSGLTKYPCTPDIELETLDVSKQATLLKTCPDGEEQPIFLFFRRYAVDREGSASQGGYYKWFTSHHDSTIKTFGVVNHAPFNAIPFSMFKENKTEAISKSIVI